MIQYIICDTSPQLRMSKKSWVYYWGVKTKQSRKRFMKTLRTVLPNRVGQAHPGLWHAVQLLQPCVAHP